MKIYIAAPYPLRDEAIAAMRRLEGQGHSVTSRWLIEIDDDSEAAAFKDLHDVCEADILILLHPEDWHDRGTGGRHVEFGYALALKKHLVIVGKRTNAFHHLSHVQVVEKVEDL